MSKASLKQLHIPSVNEDEEIRAAAQADPSAQPLGDDALAQLKPWAPRRGRPKAEVTKKLVSIRYSAEVLDYFMASDKGWQARMDEALREFVKAHPR